MEVFFAHLVSGVAVGSIYSLLTTGFNLLLLVGGVFQYAYPHVVVLSMYVGWFALQATHGNVALAIPATVGAGVGINLFTEPLFRPLAKRRAMVTSFILSIGISIILSDIMGRQINRGVPIAFPLALTGKEALVRFGVATLMPGQLATIVGSILAVVGFLYLLYRTKVGRAFRAMAQDSFTARLLGIPITRMSLVGYAIAGLLGGISAVFLIMTLGSATGILGSILAVKVFAVAMFAGLGNLKGGLICGLILGLAESFVVGYLPGDWSNAIAFAMILVVVMVKPEGVFGLRV